MISKSDVTNVVITGSAGGGGWAITGNDLVIVLTIGVLSVQLGFYCWKWYTAWKDHKHKE